MRRWHPKRVMSYLHHVIWMDGFGYYMFAKGDGTDYIFDDIRAAMRKIEELEEARRQARRQA